jgi:hypothetical protein
MTTDFMPHGIYLSRRNLLTLLSKLDRHAAGDDSARTIIKRDNKHPKYPQSMEFCIVTAIDDDEYYSTRKSGEVHPKDDPDRKVVL